jgi:hypothetical protein
MRNQRFDNAVIVIGWFLVLGIALALIPFQ